jgi:hypothetical protein
MVPDGEGNFYCVIIMRPGKDLLSARRGRPQKPEHQWRVEQECLPGITVACRLDEV